ncbi:uncharacterized protein LOC130786883 [Actinidia eriantha]|uniref:uncharacterized protein LOC130786883 n=1 Tax=Actinidia eriantha TaxID=165200 RepID=UPI00258CCB62|nr:uncharacterized protein LOC130786883 [Actinidia eriantha]XP_057503323.1 uncharacterized protein LOC130786883 [Actinidia eriantha]
MEMDERKLDYKLHEVRVCPMGRVRSSCNGMLLLNHPKRECVLQVVNVVTRCYQTLPKCPSGCPHKECGCALTFDPFTQVYKVVHVYADLFGFEIFALGCSDNSWRRVSGPWKDPWERPFDLKFRWSDPVLVSGRFLHWYVNSHQYIISMDVSDESFRATLFPGCDHPITRDNYSLLELGDCLSFVCHGFDWKIDVWVLEDFHRQVWFRKHSISAEMISYTTNYDYLLSVKYNNAVPNLDNLIPLVSLRDGEVLVFAHKHSDAFYVYETRRREMKKLKMPTKEAKPFIPHRNTLLHWNTPNGS